MLRPVSHQLSVILRVDDGADTRLLAAKPPRIETRGISMVGEGGSIFVKDGVVSRVVEVSAHPWRGGLILQDDVAGGWC